MTHLFSLKADKDSFNIVIQSSTIGEKLQELVKVIRDRTVVRNTSSNRISIDRMHVHKEQTGTDILFVRMYADLFLQPETSLGYIRNIDM